MRGVRGKEFYDVQGSDGSIHKLTTVTKGEEREG